MKRIVLAVALCTSLVALAQNVPQQISFTARLANAGAPLSGSHTLLVKLYDVATGGSEMWSESTLASADNGLVALNLGAQSPLTPAILDGRALFVELSVDGTALSPRLPVVSVPYAVRATLAASAATLGNLGPSDVALSNHNHNGAYLPVGPMLACGGTDKMVGLSANGSVICAADQGGTTYTAGAGLSLTGSSIAASFAGTGTANSIARSDHNHSGVYLPLGASLACSGTQKVTGLAANGSVVCGADVDTSTAYLAGNGLGLSGTTFNVQYAGAGLGLGTATTVARSDHGHNYACPAGFLSHWFNGGTPEGTKVFCTRPVTQTATWAQAARSCAVSYGASRLCTIQELTIARMINTPSHTQESLFSGYWLADRLADDSAAVTNSTTGDNFDAAQDPATNATGFYCCTDGNFFR